MPAPMPGSTTHRRPRLPARGAAALVVVMVLFFLLSLVAAYASRNLIFEQRTSANYYRATKAFEAAEAGLEWTLAQLNGGRIDAACAPSVDPGATTFRDRYLDVLADGRLSVRTWNDAGVERARRAACVRGAAGWACSCPDDSAPALAAPAGATTTPTFRVSFEAVAPGGPAGAVRVVAQGCSNFDASCLTDTPSGADANAEVSALVALAPALTQAPLASLTVRGALEPASARFVATHPDAVAVNSGGPAAVNMANIQTPPGSPASDLGLQSRLVSDNDPTLLAAIAPEGGLSAGERMFLGLFGAPPAAFRLQPAVRRLSCGADCAAVLEAAAAGHPGRVLWIDGDLAFAADADLTLGSAGAPVVLVVDGNLALATGGRVAIHGLVHVRGSSLQADAGADLSFTGALVAEGEDGGVDDGLLTIQGEPRFVFDADLVERARALVARRALDFGSFARVPGSWRDFR
ncbi:MAG: hypothetical protein J0L57_19565 [Burkholderiales bacterium]|nr:hypothetical protein [Burkholderiales bacterium]